MNRIRALFRPPRFEDEEKTREAFLLNVILWVLIIVPIPLLIYAFLFTPEGLSRVLTQVIFGEAVNVFLLIVLRRGYVRSTSIMQIVAFTFFFTATAWTGAGIHDPAYQIGYALVIAIAGFLIGMRGALIMVGVSLLSGGLMVVASDMGLWSFKPAIKGLSLWVVSAILFPVVAVLQYLGERLRLTALAQSRTSQAQYRLLADHMKDQVWLMDMNMNITYVSPSVERLTGYSSDEIKKLPFEKILTSESFRKAEDFITIKMPKAIKASSKDLIFRTLELEFILKGGQKVWGECAFSFIRDDNGKPLYILGEARDITERKNTEEKLHDSEEKYRTILEDIQEGYFEVDLTGNFIFFNDTLCRVMGYSREELMGMNNRQYMEKEELKKIFEAYNTVYITGAPNKELIWRITRKDGTIRYIEGSISLKKDSSGNPAGFRGIARDITDRRQVEKKLREEEQKFRTLAEQSSDVIIMVNNKGIITYENPAVSVLGINPEQRIGGNVFERVHPDDLKLMTDSFHRLFSDKNAPIQKAEVRVRHADGSWHLFEAVGSNLIRDNVIEAVILNVRDITERKNAEEMLKKSELKYRNIFENSIEGIYQSSIEGRFMTANAALARMAGYDSPEELIESIKDIGTQLYVHPEDRKRFMEIRDAKGFVEGFEVEF